MELWKNSKYLNSFGLVVLLKETKRSESEFQYLAAAYLTGLRPYVLVVWILARLTHSYLEVYLQSPLAFWAAGCQLIRKPDLGYETSTGAH